MAIDRKLLEILVCPITKQPVSMLSQARLEQVNGLIEEGKLHTVGGVKLDKPLEQALITKNGSTLYPVNGNIPVMLEAQSIPCEQIAAWV